MKVSAGVWVYAKVIFSFTYCFSSQAGIQQQISDIIKLLFYCTYTHDDFNKMFTVLLPFLPSNRTVEMSCELYSLTLSSSLILCIIFFFFFQMFKKEDNVVCCYYRIICLL